MKSLFLTFELVSHSLLHQEVKRSVPAALIAASKGGLKVKPKERIRGEEPVMAYCPLSLHRTGLQNYLSIFIDRVAGQRTKEGYHLPLEKPFFCSRGTPYVGSFLLSWNGERKRRSRVSNKHASLKARVESNRSSNFSRGRTGKRKASLSRSCIHYTITGL